MKSLMLCAAAVLAAVVTFAGATPVRAQYVETDKFFIKGSDANLIAPHGDGWTAIDASLTLESESSMSGGGAEMKTDVDGVPAYAFVEWEWRGSRVPPVRVSVTGSSHVTGSVLAFRDEDEVGGFSEGVSGQSTGVCNANTNYYAEDHSGSFPLSTYGNSILSTTVFMSATTGAYTTGGPSTSFASCHAKAKLEISAPVEIPDDSI